MFISDGETTIVPWPKPRWLVEPEEQTAMMVPAAEVTMLERHMAKPEHKIAVAEMQHQIVPAEVIEMSRLEPWGMPELECKATVVEAPEVS